MGVDHLGRPCRRSHRLAGWDYSTPSAYFVTICTDGGRQLFGRVADFAMTLSDAGVIAQDEWLASERIRCEIELDVFVIMPNHMHAVVWILPAANDPYALMPPVSETGASPEGLRTAKLGALMAGFKAAVTRRINWLENTPVGSVWQSNYYDHIVRSEPALEAIREYIAGNPARWTLDRYNDQATGTDPKAKDLWELLRGDRTER